MSWEIYLTDEVNDWLDHLLEHDGDSHRQVVSAVEALAEAGPNLGRPLVDRIKASSLHNLKGTASGIVRTQRDTDLVHVRPLAQRDPARGR